MAHTKKRGSMAKKKRHGLPTRARQASAPATAKVDTTDASAPIDAQVDVDGFPLDPDEGEPAAAATPPGDPLLERVLADLAATSTRVKMLEGIAEFLRGQDGRGEDVVRYLKSVGVETGSISGASQRPYRRRGERAMSKAARAKAQSDRMKRYWAQRRQTGAV